MIWHPEGESDILSQGCGNFGCEYISCHSTVPSVNNNNNTSNTTSSTQNTDYLLKFKEYQLRNSAGKRMISAGECQISSLNKDCFQYNNQNRSIIQGGDNTKNAFLNNSLNPTNSTNSSNTTTSQLITTISPVNGTSLTVLHKLMFQQALLQFANGTNRIYLKITWQTTSPNQITHSAMQ